MSGTSEVAVDEQHEPLVGLYVSATMKLPSRVVQVFIRSEKWKAPVGIIDAGLTLEKLQRLLDTYDVGVTSNVNNHLPLVILKTLERLERLA